MLFLNFIFFKRRAVFNEPKRVMSWVLKGKGEEHFARCSSAATCPACTSTQETAAGAHQAATREACEW